MRIVWTKRNHIVGFTTLVETGEIPFGKKTKFKNLHKMKKNNIFNQRLNEKYCNTTNNV